jgi:hypothetical protein
MFSADEAARFMEALVGSFTPQDPSQDPSQDAYAPPDEGPSNTHLVPEPDIAKDEATLTEAAPAKRAIANSVEVLSVGVVLTVLRRLSKLQQVNI